MLPYTNSLNLKAYACDYCKAGLGDRYDRGGAAESCGDTDFYKECGMDSVRDGTKDEIPNLCRIGAGLRVLGCICSWYKGRAGENSSVSADSCA